LSRNARSRPQAASDRSKILCRGLVGDSEAVRHVRELIRKIAPSRANILITGETGSGKEIVARNIHHYSDQSAGAFVPINCSAIPPDLLESELFGHKKGAFTGATTDRDGRFLFAADGTLFLDEIGDMSPALQVKMLRVLEERVIYPVGCNESIPMTARLVAATHRNLEQCVAESTFREDLYYRLNVVPVTVPPLRERREDISQLVAELGHRLQREQGLTVELTLAAIACLEAHDWPGNVRELANLMERLAVIHPNGTADVADLPDKYRIAAEHGADHAPGHHEVWSHSSKDHVLPVEGFDLRKYLKSTEAALIRQALHRSNGAITQAAALLQIGRTTLTEKVKRLGFSDYQSN
jgi:sigma-54 specific flagellar transcriptional regulator A